MKELKRSRTDRMVAGICGGIGVYLGIDPNVIRLIWVVVTLFSGGLGLLAYLLAWILLPGEEAPPAAASAPVDTPDVITVEPEEVR
ncbi:MAG TPA: PspC domain-containing protein [Methanoregulaceae archaeon]|nr:PspC domain-containing protein [Methanoregulaceae archaeon]HOV67912.1 PspC domain-containing protein [Methanoregulaceae archaeon]HQJ87789.1 PspC domain-containing protein [Methanoregulaceae archaeon]